MVDEDNSTLKRDFETASADYVQLIFDTFSDATNAFQFQTNHIKPTELCLNNFWVNYQYKHEFNPMHSHSGVISFVIWLNIPTNWEEQHELPISKNSNSPSASDFSFSYTDICGNIQAYAVNLAPKDNGLMLVFPATLNHLVYPFYKCDSKRVSLSGNICWK